MRHQRGFYITAAAVIVFEVFLLSSRPLPEQVPKIPGMDKIFHFIVYAALSSAIFGSIIKSKNNHKKALFISIFLAVLYGLSDEFHQSFVPGRECSLLDLLADFLGAAFGAAISLKSLIKRKFSAQRNSTI